MQLTRRRFLTKAASTGAGAFLITNARADDKTTAVRRYNVCLSPDTVENDPELLHLVREAGVTAVWGCGFLYGYWPFSMDSIRAWRQSIDKAGMAAHMINLPLGHPGNSLGSSDGSMPLTPPKRWKSGVLPDGRAYAGTSWHPPATEENAAAVRELAAAGFKQVFLDDDFRLARGPGSIGGCYCADHKARFLASRGYAEDHWAELLDAVNRRKPTRLLREWIGFTCDELTACFRAQQAAAPNVELGIMVMYMGAEKAGIRLDDYRSTLLRVGELMFDDRSFAPVKGKTDELFSALFHRRFARPEHAFSETTAFPATKLSAPNLAAKLTTSTIADIRNTMFMSGMTPFPRTYWEVLGPAMKKQARMHERLAGHIPRGPFKHFWGEAGRMVSNDNPYSLFLASGIPFEVVDKPPHDGWTFLGDADAEVASDSPGTMLIARTAKEPCRAVEESLEALYSLKREVAPSLKDTPYVVDEQPVACAWYPTARAALVWNLDDHAKHVTLKYAEATRTVQLDPLGSELVDGL